MTHPTTNTAARELSFQSRVQPWMLECFGAEIAGDMVERGDRFLEESLELLQSHGYERAWVSMLVDYVWGRPAGEPTQEVGGVMVTLAAYCLAAGIDMHEAGETELARILRPEIVEKIRHKQASKKGIRTPLPTLTQQQGGEQEVGDGLPELPEPECRGAGWRPNYTAEQMRAYATAALRTKQPAASEGGVARALVWVRQWAPFTAPEDREHIAVIEEALAAYDPERMARCGNTSKQAAVEAVPIGWFTDDHLTDRSATTYDKTVADRWVAKGWPITPIYTAPPRHPADEGIDGTR